MKIFTKIIILIIFIFCSNSYKLYAEEKIKIGLLVPLTGQNSYIGKSIIKSVRLAINKINNPILEILPRDTASDPTITLKKAKERYGELNTNDISNLIKKLKIIQEQIRVQKLKSMKFSSIDFEECNFYNRNIIGSL